LLTKKKRAMNHLPERKEERIWGRPQSSIPLYRSQDVGSFSDSMLVDAYFFRLAASA
jgi:hypothetical protein